jgi:protein FAM50
VKKNAARGKLSFAMDEDEDSSEVSRAPTPKSKSSKAVVGAEDVTQEDKIPKRRLGPNSTLAAAPKIMTKSALAKEAQTRDQLRKEFLAMQEVVKLTEMAIPFVFYDGTNIPGGICRIKKGEHVWLFLDKARKVGAEMGVGADLSRKGWARISVDDLMLVRGDIIIPHHYEFYYFLANKSMAFHGRIFPYSAEATSATPAPIEDDGTYDPMKSRRKDKASQFPSEDLEGFSDEPSLTKVVDRRWYEKNKHIYPATLWEEFDATKDYTTGQRKDASGNALFFS